MVQEDNIDSLTVGAVAVVGAIVTFVVIVLSAVCFHQLQKANEIFKSPLAGVTQVSRVVTEQQAKLNRYHWVNQEAGIIAIPIDKAMEQALKELSVAADAH